MEQRVLRWARRVSNDERGSAFLVVGTFLILLLFVGLATDFGILLRHRRALQNACDSGALAGAQDLKTVAAPGPHDTAVLFATRDMTENHVVWNTVDAVPQDKNGSATGVSPVRLQVTIHATVPLFFLALVRPSLPVGVQCAAQRVPVPTTGLDPFGMNDVQFNTIWTQLNGCSTSNNTAGCFTGCPLIGASLSGLTGTQQAICSQDYVLNVNTNSQTWGAGNTGTLQMVNSVCPGGTNGAGYFSCLMYQGTGSGTSGGTPPPPYCANTLNTGTNPPSGNTPYPACSIVSPSPGESLGSGGQTNPPSNYGTGLRGGVASVCSTPNPLSNPSASHWILILPLLDPSLWGNGNGANGSSARIDIVGFAAFEFDCPAITNANFTPSGANLPGRFVSLLDVQGATGNPNGVDTGVETIILVQ